LIIRPPVQATSSRPGITLITGLCCVLECGKPALPALLGRGTTSAGPSGYWVGHSSRRFAVEFLSDREPGLCARLPGIHLLHLSCTTCLAGATRAAENRRVFPALRVDWPSLQKNNSPCPGHQQAKRRPEILFHPCATIGISLKAGWSLRPDSRPAKPAAGTPQDIWLWHTTCTYPTQKVAVAGDNWLTSLSSGRAAEMSAPNHRPL
jgi:hypothetical protein